MSVAAQSYAQFVHGGMCCLCVCACGVLVCTYTWETREWNASKELIISDRWIKLGVTGSARNLYEAAQRKPCPKQENQAKPNSHSFCKVEQLHEDLIYELGVNSLVSMLAVATRVETDFCGQAQQNKGMNCLQVDKKCTNTRSCLLASDENTANRVVPLAKMFAIWTGN